MDFRTDLAVESRTLCGKKESKNANSFEKQGFSKVLEEESVTAESLTATVREVYKNRQTYIDSMNQNQSIDSITKIVSLLNDAITQ